MEENNNNDINIPFIQLDFDECMDTKLSKTEFNKGIKYGSYLSGVVSCLFNSGLSSEEVKEIICKMLDKNKIEDSMKDKF